uniref:Uncharacterized protein n=1 Tax=Acrobeloides nanus TaxID=290746 RepID=A0A914DDT9_9BILA
MFQQDLEILKNLLSQLSPDAAPYGQQLLQICGDQDTPTGQYTQQIQAVVNQAPARVQQELRRVLSQYSTQIFSAPALIGSAK